MELIDSLEFEARRLEKELERVNKDIREAQRNKIFGTLEENTYYLISDDASWSSFKEEFIFKFKKNVRLAETLTDSPYLFIDGLYIRKCTSRSETSSNKDCISWEVDEDLKHYIGQNEIYITKLSEADVKKIKADISSKLRGVWK